MPQQKKKQKKVTHRAGVIPYRIHRGEVLMLFMKPSNSKFGGDVWQIAKGKYEEGESPHEAAFREAHEELGLRKDNVSVIYNLGVFLGYTTIYLAHVITLKGFDPFHFETSETKWMTLQEFVESGRDLHKTIVRHAHSRIKEEEQL